MGMYEMETSSHMHGIPEISTESYTDSNDTNNKLAIMKLRDSLLSSREFLSEPGTPTGRRKSFDFSSALEHGGGRSSLARSSSRKISTSTRRSSALMGGSNANTSRVSMELSRQAEGKFFALMDLVTNASREASSLKEVWAEMIRERESLTREREELLEQITEVTETLERKENEHHHHGNEIAERKRQVEKLVLDLSVALSTISDHEKKRGEHERDLLRTRNELHTLRDTFSRTTVTHEKLKSDFQAIELRLKTVEEERDHFKRHGDQYAEELRSLTREHTDLKSQSLETISKLETSRKEILSLTDRLKIAEMERDDFLVEKDRLQDLLRKSNSKNEETSLELVEITEKHEHRIREIAKFKETIRDLESEHAKVLSTVDSLRREIKTKSTALEEAEARAAEFVLKYEHLKRENVMTKEKIVTLELERTEHQELIEKSREQARLTLLERNQLKDDVDMWRRKAEDHQRTHTTLQESLRKAESTLLETRSEIHTLTDRLTRAERERGEHRDKNEHHFREITSLKEKLVVLQAELRTVGEHRNRLRDELQEYKQQYEEITESMTSYRDNSSTYEYEIENLRSMLREARENKERAITARNAADRERDEYIHRYEEKCREMERYEQTASSQWLTRTKSEGGRNFSSSRMVSRSNTTGTTIHHNHNGNREGALIHHTENGDGGENALIERIEHEEEREREGLTP